ncbi:hypothetical protein LYZ90_09395 [Xanthomonas hortorum pv. vitians]|uniref:hypothetical protein n=1 Tax=Xanthomonas hortorum TaxID=56454 RepID=UPI00093807C6|nr:hypothetical protein [Xanthomonas hortorum]APP85443.1 hypothetical protein BI317_15955 [Xanthomonas hortorum pv. gardneri]MCE4302942.1 hypothetical protein [Xanthomonas hortorum pv. vitians]MCE4311064.1 hypothetical protein [Xanthomonas hortorum pv. vitians]MDT7825265.1 hypothetical protein [Xanthomonas hortorum pv. vitians]NMI31615.1 hypothetical protein [Xanthomonas hortorum pv. vitians]
MAGTDEAFQTALIEVQLLTAFLNKTPLVPDEVSLALSREYSRSMWDKMLATGCTLGEASGGPGTAMVTRDHAEFVAYMRSISDDLAAQIKIVKEGVEHYLRHGDSPPPAYAWRVAVILRKRKIFSVEADFLEAFAAHFCRESVGRREIQIAQRAIKARMLATRAATAASE